LWMSMRCDWSGGRAVCSRGLGGRNRRRRPRNVQTAARRIASGKKLLSVSISIFSALPLDLTEPIEERLRGLLRRRATYLLPSRLSPPEAEIARGAASKARGAEPRSLSASEDNIAASEHKHSVALTSRIRLGIVRSSRC
jgi:hypothetical protein